MTINWIGKLRIYQYGFLFIASGSFLFFSGLFFSPIKSDIKIFLHKDQGILAGAGIMLILVGSIELIIFTISHYSLSDRVRDINHLYFENVGYGALISSVILYSVLWKL